MVEQSGEPLLLSFPWCFPHTVPFDNSRNTLVGITQTKEPRPFDCVLVADISRLGGRLDRVTRLIAAFRAGGVFVQAVQGQFDSRVPQFAALLNEDFINRIRQYLKPAGRQLPMCGR
jgi:hypothetical protein